jgi:photosystem II stability/assembly factor-like uncharacterized protein
MQDYIKHALFAACIFIVLSISADIFAQSKPQRRADFRALTMKDEAGTVPPDALMAAKAQATALIRPANKLPGEAGAGITTASWQALGPGNIGGRVRAIAIHPTNPNRIVMGAVSGGIWTSDNAGASWAKVNDWLPSLAISSIVYDPLNSNTMYAGTGESFASQGTSQDAAKKGAGIFKSTNGGNGWTRLTATDPAASALAETQWTYVNGIAIHPSNSQVIYAATGKLMRSTTGGVAWAEISSTAGSPIPASANITNVRFNPANSNNIVASGDAGIFYSLNGGQTGFSAAVIGGSGRTEIAFASNGWVFAYRASGGVYRSQDNGANWTLLSSPADMSQISYNNVIWVDPTNPSRLLVGATKLQQSADGGISWQTVGGYCNDEYFHADQHAIVADPGYNGTTNRRIYIGNDGGIYKTDDLNTTQDGCFPANGWTNLNNGLFITQFTGGAGSPTLLFGGTQDNGSLIRVSGTTWRRYVGGDGGPVAYAATAAPNHLFGQYQTTLGHPIHVSSDAGATTYSDNAHYNLGCRGGAFYAPMAIDNTATAWYTASSQLCVSENPTSSSRGWRIVPTPSISQLLSVVEVSPNSKNIVWIAGAYNGASQRCFPDSFDLSMCPYYGIYKTSNALAATPGWTQVGSQIPQGRYITRIYIDPRDTTNQTVYLSLGGFTNSNLWKTTNGGANWTNIHGTLPAVPIRAITTHPTIPGYLYVGTEIGLFTSENAGASWYFDINNQPQNDGPANVSVEHLFWTDPQTLVAATYGRGMFKAVIGAPALTGVVSRKTHGTAGTFDIAIDPNGSLTAGSAITVDPRMIGTGHKIVFNFDKAPTSTGTVAVVNAAGASIGTASATLSGNTVIVTLTGVADVQRALVKLTNVSGLAVDVQAAVGFLVGDVDENRLVAGTDINLVKSAVANATTPNALTFKRDLNADGLLGPTDVNIVKSKASSFVPPF